ncbi:cupin domain-containing protein [Uliginosibacterium sp. H3]|uniref:Cupin domain-containing protein n=1 Tax=Uliginosibacterium silvisoli TaxID=3114758 RepID=A0ABU6K361_9RHOO|nr:cupin domain-containing protein [Uliginosibacterium sp. H3]
MQVLSRDNAEHYTWGEGCDGWHLLKSDALSVIEERVPPGKSESRHLHMNAQQCFYIVEGEAAIEMAGQEVLLSAGQSLVVPARTPHQFFNRSASDVRFLVISQPSTRGDRQSADPAP